MLLPVETFLAVQREPVPQGAGFFFLATRRCHSEAEGLAPRNVVILRQGLCIPHRCHPEGAFFATEGSRLADRGLTPGTPPGRREGILRCAPE